MSWVRSVLLGKAKPWEEPLGKTAPSEVTRQLPLTKEEPPRWDPAQTDTGK